VNHRSLQGELLEFARRAAEGTESRREGQWHLRPAEDDRADCHRAQGPPAAADRWRASRKRLPADDGRTSVQRPVVLSPAV